MKSLIKIYSKYIGMAWIISLLFLLINCTLFMIFALNRFDAEQKAGYLGLQRMEEFAVMAVEKEGSGSFQVTEAGIEYMEQRGLEFLLVLNEEGDVVSEWNRPEGLKEHYTAGEIAAFSKWYLEGYPVGVWRIDDALLVLGYPKDSLWKYNIEWPADFFHQFLTYLEIGITGNILLVLVMVVLLGYRYYRSMQPMAEGLQLLAANKRVYLSEKGVTSELAGQINKASAILEEQRKNLKARDDARTEWIAGISHDIRTPLSMITGYAEELECDNCISEEDRKKAGIIKSQGLQIKQLIEDLNLTSRLAYQMQPLKMEPFRPAPVIRNLIAERINAGLEERYQLIPEIEPAVEERLLEADKGLLLRAVRNLINNSIRHNPGGCDIHIEVCADETGIRIAVLDNGCGIPEEIAGLLTEDDSAGSNGHSGAEGEADKRKPHIMGLRIVKQIAHAHKGDFCITDSGHRVEIRLPALPAVNGRQDNNT